MNKSILQRSAAALTLALGALVAQAAPLYGADNTLYSVDATTGASVAIDSGDGAYRLGLAWNANNNTMYSIGVFNGTLSTVDLANGNTTFVGDNTFSLTGLAFDTTYANLYSLNGNGGGLVRMDANDASAVLVGGGGNNMLDLSMNSAGVLFGGGFGGIGTFNTTTGAFSLIGGSLAWTAIAFDENDQLFGIELSSDALYRIDTATGNATLVGGSIGGDVRGMSFAFSRHAVPEPGVLALVSLGLLGVAASRRKA
jgi:PEP-CTERM motif